LTCHMTIHTGKIQCGETFTEKICLVKHKITHIEENTEDKIFKCNACDKVFLQNAHPIANQKKHTRENAHQCSYCEKNFSNKSHLIRHIRIHTGEKPFKCS
ncbi:unnamed protein product, partial [Meganyctiphanes norvegica]